MPGDWLRRGVRSVVPRKLYHNAAETWNLLSGARMIGYQRYRALRDLYPDRSARGGEPVAISLPTLSHPIHVRPGTTDPDEVVHSCIRKAYAVGLPDGSVNVIIDAGANIGDTSTWYLSTFSDATVVSIEPDESNYSILARNCRPYGKRSIPQHAGLWSSDVGLKVLRAENVESGIEVRAVAFGEQPDCNAVSMRTLVERHQLATIDIFKCDIEGSEREVFTTDSDFWLERTRSIFIEIHGSACYDAVRAATRRHGFVERIYRDIVIFRK